MNNTFQLSGFKCFRDETFDLKNLTVLTGSNGTGKSSLIQAILLIRLAIEKNALNSDNSSYSSEEWRRSPTPLNLGYELSLGTVNDIFNENDSKDSKLTKITLALDKETFEVPLPDEEDDDTSVNIILKEPSFNKANIPFWRKKEFYYLYTERFGPRLALPFNYTDFVHCGHRGEFTAQVLLKNDFLKVQGARFFPDLKSENLPLQVDAWLDSICPGTSVKVEALGTMSAQIKLRNNSVKNHVLATNIGFGISYSLPIIVTGLIAKSDSVFIVENPEAHLHPKGQSNMGYFLGKVAASGVKVIIETHSEHIINGIRRAALSTSDLSIDDINIYFFNGFEKEKESIIPIRIEANGDLSDFPVDFFDQARQDLLEILNLSKRN